MLFRLVIHGGEEPMQKILKSANKKIQELHPGSPKVSTASIVSLKSENGRVKMCLNAAKKGDNPALQVFVKKQKAKKNSIRKSKFLTV